MNNAELTKEIEILKNNNSLLEDRLKTLETRFSFDGGNFEELVRNTVLVDIDNSSAKTRVAVASLVNGNVTVPVNPDGFLRVYFRGKILNISYYNLT